MSDAFRVLVKDTPTATGEVDYVSSGFGTPIGAIIITGLVDSENTQKNSIRSSIGFTDFTFDRCCGLTCDGNDLPTISKRQANNKLVHTRTQDGASNLHVAVNAGTTTDGITVDWTTVDSTAFKMLVILIGSDAASDIYVNDFSPTTADTEQDITDPGFQADWIIAQWVDRSVPANGDDATWAIGVAAYRSGAWSEWSCGMFSNHNVSTSDVHASAQDDCLIAAIDGSGEVGEISVTATNANGFSVTPAGVGYTTDVIYICGKNPSGRQCQVAGFDGAAEADQTSGTWTVDDFAFQGDNLFLIGQRLTTLGYDTGTGSNNSRLHVSVTGADGTSKSFQVSAKNNNATNPKQRCTQGDDFLYAFNQNEALEYNLDTHAFTSDGWTTNVVTASPTAAPKWGALLFGEAPLSVSTYMSMTNVGQ